MASADRLAIALLAAGQSTRFGETDKLDAILGEKPLRQWAADAGHSLDAKYRFLVQGPDAPASAAGYETLINPDAKRGMSTSLRVAAQAAEKCEATALLILLADMPFVRTEHLAAIVDASKDAPLRTIFSSAPGGAPQPPALFPSHLFAELQKMEDDKGARGLAKEAIFVVAAGEHLLDIDTLADLEQARAYLASQPVTP